MTRSSKTTVVLGLVLIAFVIIGFFAVALSQIAPQIGRKIPAHYYERFSQALTGVKSPETQLPVKMPETQSIPASAGEVTPQTPSKQEVDAEEKFLSYEPWPGGFNNRRTSFEHAVLFALILNRTLVLPPWSAALNDDHTRYEPIVPIEEAYDLDALKKIIKFVRFSDLDVHRVGAHSSLRNSPQNVTDICAKSPKRSRDIFYCESQMALTRYAYWLRSCHCVWVYPKDGWFTKDHYNRIPISLPINNNHTILHYQRMFLGPFQNYVMIKPDHRPRIMRAMRDGLRYRRELQDLAQRIVKFELGGRDQFSCVHARRADFFFAYKSAVTAPAQMLQNIIGLLKPKERLFIATDDIEGLKKEIASSPEALAILTNLTGPAYWSDLVLPLQADTLYPNFKLRNALVPLVTQLICAEARIFIGAPLSTVSSLIVRLRGYRKAPGPWYTDRIATNVSRPDLRVHSSWAWESPDAWEDL